MTLAPSASIREIIRQRGPVTFAEFMALALYEPGLGYYARAAQRSGRAGDFFTSVDVGALFGELLAVQIAEMWRLLGAPPTMDLIEAGAGNGRLSRDVLDALAAASSPLYDALRLHLVEASSPARDAQRGSLGPHARKLASSGPALPRAGTGVLFANELLDALPAHVVVMRQEGLREVYVDADEDGLVEREGPPSTPRLAESLFRAGARLETGWRAEVNLAAEDWMAEAAGALARGFFLLVDYGHTAPTLFSASHAGGTVAAYRRHVVEAAVEGRAPWLEHAGECDITSHVNFTSVEQAGERAGLDLIALTDQSSFLLGLGAADRVAGLAEGREGVARRLALKTLLVPGGLGSTHAVMILGKGVGTPALAGAASGRRVR